MHRRSGALPGWTQCLKPYGTDASIYHKVEQSLIFQSWCAHYQGLCLDRKMTFQNLSLQDCSFDQHQSPWCLLTLYTRWTCLYINQNLQVLLPALCNVHLPNFCSLTGSFTDSQCFLQFNLGLLVKVIQIEKVSDTLRKPTLFLFVPQFACLPPFRYTFSPSTSVGFFFAQLSFSFLPQQREAPVFTLGFHFSLYSWLNISH